MDPRRRSTTSGAVRGMGCAMRPDYPSVCFDYDFINNKTRGNKGGGIKRLCHAVIPFGKHQTEEPIAPNLSQTHYWTRKPPLRGSLLPANLQPGHLLDKLLGQWSTFAAFLASFLYVAVIWLNHRA